MASPSEPTDGSEPSADPKRLTDIVLDALVYAPIGLTLDGQELAPELARRGRQHAAAARQIGEFAVKAGLRRLDAAVASRITEDPQSPPAPDEPVPADRDTDSSPADEVTVPAEDPATAAGSADDADASQTDAAAPEDPSQPSTPSSSHLAIPDYDLLAASQVVRRLDGLDPDQLEDVRVYEAATRDRRTILHKIARIQG